ncbi:hypothetical protein BC937DRAFT_91045 [Endogone sp. FLAS-F59071]|nr:hypothetical protein BC937DRAFT_91045 [Endogone sp. FLAS-F59071]|eukprot:RUS21926.1 hypothetical protein BC937DRAFT_91045 [Endogone sp. FLAS-F59071]
MAYVKSSTRSLRDFINGFFPAYRPLQRQSRTLSNPTQIQRNIICSLGWSGRHAEVQPDRACEAGKLLVYCCIIPDL